MPTEEKQFTSDTTIQENITTEMSTSPQEQNDVATFLPAEENQSTPDTKIPDTTTPAPVVLSQEQQNDLTIFFNQDQFTIIKRYRKIHRFLFKHGVYVLLLLL